MLCVFNGTVRSSLDQEAPWLHEPVTVPDREVDSGSNHGGREAKESHLWSHVLLQRHLSGYYLNGPLSILKMRLESFSQTECFITPFILGVCYYKEPVRLYEVLCLRVCIFPLSATSLREKCYLFKLAAFQAQSTVYTGATCLHPKIPRLLFLEAVFKLLRWIYVWLYKSNKWWEMKLFAISMAIQNKKDGICDMQGQKYKDVKRDALEEQPINCCLSPWEWVSRPGVTLLPSTLLPGLLPFLLPHLLQAQPRTKAEPQGASLPGFPRQAQGSQTGQGHRMFTQILGKKESRSFYPG